MINLFLIFMKNLSTSFQIKTQIMNDKIRYLKNYKNMNLRNVEEKQICFITLIL